MNKSTIFKPMPSSQQLQVSPKTIVFVGVMTLILAGCGYTLRGTSTPSATNYVVHLSGDDSKLVEATRIAMVQSNIVTTLRDGRDNGKNVLTISLSNTLRQKQATMFDNGGNFTDWLLTLSTRITIQENSNNLSIKLTEQASSNAATASLADIELADDIGWAAINEKVGRSIVSRVQRYVENNPIQRQVSE